MQCTITHTNINDTSPPPRALRGTALAITARVNPSIFRGIYRYLTRRVLWLNTLSFPTTHPCRDALSLPFRALPKIQPRQRDPSHHALPLSRRRTRMATCPAEGWKTHVGNVFLALRRFSVALAAVAIPPPREGGSLIHFLKPLNPRLWRPQPPHVLLHACFLDGGRVS